MSTENLTIELNGNKIEVEFLKGLSESEISPSLTRKLIPRDELAELGDFLRRRGNQIVFTTGVFDMIHIGHLRYLQLARSLGDVLVVGVNTDNSVKRLKGENRPILDEVKRAETLSFLSGVEYITFFDEDAGAETIKILKPNSYLCVEGSWEGDIATKEEVVTMVSIGGKVFYAPKQGPTVSTSEIIERISMQAVERLAAELPRLVADGLKF